jgi:AcrR family transcriptional regulator
MDSEIVGSSATGGPEVHLRPELAPTAQRVLEAAKRIVLRDGLPGLTLDAVAEESGEYRSAIRYHFGDKDGLVAAIMDSTALTPTTEPLFATAIELPHGKARTKAHMDALRRVSVNREQFRFFWYLLPQMLRDPELRRRLRDLYDDYIAINADGLGLHADDPPDQRRLFGLAVLVTAVCDGLGLMACLDDDAGPLGEDLVAARDGALRAAYDVLGEMVAAYAPQIVSASPIVRTADKTDTPQPEGRRKRR